MVTTKAAASPVIRLADLEIRLEDCAVKVRSEAVQITTCRASLLATGASPALRGQLDTLPPATERKLQLRRPAQNRHRGCSNKLRPSPVTTGTNKTRLGFSCSSAGCILNVHRHGASEKSCRHAGCGRTRVTLIAESDHDRTIHNSLEVQDRNRPQKSLKLWNDLRQQET